MKKLFHFNFSIFRSGGARRHSPLCSLIIALILVLSITLYPVSPVRANALQQIQPVYDTTVTQLYEMVSQRMTPAQEDIFNLMLGTYAAGYGGFAQYQLSDPYANEDGVLAWLKSCGVELYNTILSFGGIGEDPITGVDLRPVIKSLVEVAYGVGIKAQTYTGVDPEADFLADVSSSTNFYLPYTLDINAAINSALAYVGGMYDWQFDESRLEFSASVPSVSISGASLVTYNSYLSELGIPRIFGDYSSSNYYNYVCSPNNFDLSPYHILFLDLSDNSINLVDSSGTVFPTISSTYLVNYVRYTPSESYVSHGSSFVNTYGTFSVDMSSFNSVGDVFDYYLNTASSNSSFIRISYLCYMFNNFVDTFYYGTSWDNKTEYLITSDLNISDVPIEYVSNPPADSATLLDIKGLIQDLIDTNELRAPVINNFYYPDEISVPESDLVRITYDPTDYAGVVSVPDGVWDGLATDNHDGFIDYLWYMTKPLVQFTAGFIESVTFGPEGDFDETGPGIIVFGVVSLGLVGGLVSKFLL